MSTKPLYPSIPSGAKALTRQSSKTRNASETHQSIDQQIEAFLKSGKQIQKIPRGVSGPPRAPGAPYYIHISKTDKTT